MTAHTIFGPHTFSNSTFVFSSCWCFNIILNTGNGSKCLGSLLKVQLASVPQVIPLEGFPASQEHPIKNSKTTQKTSIPTQAHHLVICACQATRKSSAPNTQQINGQKENIASPARSQRLTQAGCAGKRWQQTRLWQELGPNFATVTPVPLTAVGMGQCLQASPSSPLSATRPRTYSCPCANQPLNCMAGAGGGKQF